MDNNPYEPPKGELRPTGPSGGGVLASVWIRLGAAIIDGIVLWPVNFILHKIFVRTPDMGQIMEMAKQGKTIDPGDFVPGFFTMLILQVLFVAAYIGINFVLLKKGQTVGKMLLKLQIQRRSDGTLLPVQELIMKRILPIYGAALVLSAVHWSLTFLIVIDSLCIFRPQRNTIHDDIANTKVVTLEPVTIENIIPSAAVPETPAK